MNSQSSIRSEVLSTLIFQVTQTNQTIGYSIFSSTSSSNGVDSRLIQSGVEDVGLRSTIYTGKGHTSLGNLTQCNTSLVLQFVICVLTNYDTLHQQAANIKVEIVLSLVSTIKRILLCNTTQNRLLLRLRRHSETIVHKEFRVLYNITSIARRQCYINNIGRTGSIGANSLSQCVTIQQYSQVNRSTAGVCCEDTSLVEYILLPEIGEPKRISSVFDTVCHRFFEHIKVLLVSSTFQELDAEHLFSASVPSYSPTSLLEARVPG